MTDRSESPRRGASERSSADRAKRRRTTRGAHFSDYFGIVRAHWLPAAVVALAVFVWIMASALFATPVYEATTRLEIGTGAGAQEDFLSDMLLYGGSTQQGTEMEVLRSYTVAQRAAEDRFARASIVLEEKNLYRPWNVLIRPWTDSSWRPCRLTLDLLDDAPEVAGVWWLTFDATGRSLTIRRGDEDDGPATTVAGFTLGDSYEDLDTDGRRSPHEPYDDLNQDGEHNEAESFTDRNQNGLWDREEPYTDANDNGGFDAAEPFEDRNANHAWDEPEVYEDLNGNGRYDAGDPFVDRDANGRWDAAEPLDDLNDNGRRDLGESFEDVNGNGRWDDEEPLVRDHDGNGTWDPGTEIQGPGIAFRLTLEEGDPAGRTFVLRIRSKSQTSLWIHGNARVESVGGWSGIIDLKFSASSPHVAERLADAVARGYLALRNERRQERVRRTLAWLDAEIRRVQADLDGAVDAQSDYVRDHQAALLPERAQGILDRQGELVQRRFQLKQSLGQLDVQLAALKEGRTPDDMLTAIGVTNIDARSQALIDQRTALSMERAVLTRRVTARDPQVEEVDARLAFVREELKDAVQALVAERRTALEREREALQASLDQVQADEEQQATVLATLPALERRLVELARPVQVNEAFLASLKQSKKEAEMAQAGSVPTAHVIDPAFASTGRKSPVLARQLLIAVFLGLFLGVAAAFALDYFDRRVRSPQEIEEALGLPIVATVPAFQSMRRKDRPKKGALVALHAPNSVLAEAYRTLRANIRFSAAGDQKPIRTMAITSSLQQEGKSVTTLNLAITMAEAGSKVIVVDADTRRPSTHLHIGGVREPGLVDVLRGERPWKEVRRTSPVPNLDLIPAGRTPKNPGALLDSDAFRTLLDELQETYDHVLVDVPPVLAVADAASFFRRLDAVFLLVRYGRYHVEVAQGAQEQIERLGGNLVGVVFNGFDVRRAARRAHGYYGYYGYYGRYGGYEDRSS